jgi:hypothetical protein
VLFASVGSGVTANLPALDATSIRRGAESPPRAPSRTILRL